MPMTKTAPAPVRDDALAILNRLGVPESALAAHGLPARSPITGEVVAHAARRRRPTRRSAAIGRARKAFLAWRTVPAPRRGEFVRLLGEELRAAKDDLGRLVTLETGKILSEGLGEVAGDDRHLRLRRRAVAPALRPHHRDRAAGPPDDGDVASARRLRRHLGVQLPRRGVVRGTRRWRFVCGDPVVWKPSEKTPLTALAMQAIVAPRRGALRRRARRACRRF